MRSRAIRWRAAILPVLLLAGILLAAWINLPLGTRLANRTVFSATEHLPHVAPFQPGQRILLLAPHPDDETLCCAGLIQQAIFARATVHVVWVTPGDGFELDGALLSRRLDPTGAAMMQLARTRVREARTAATVLGLRTDQTSFLGYPDGGLFALFLEHYAVPFTSPYTGQSTVYLQTALRPGAAYTGANLEQDLDQVISRFNPDLVLAPAAEDQHPDHRTVSYLATRIMSERRQVNHLRFWVVHGGLEWPLPKGRHPELPLTIPPRAPTLPWQQAVLTPAQQKVKHQAIQTYVTQTALLGRFMAAFDRHTELLSPGREAATVSPPVR
jgi:LmbE family N-acetylglucosaminyl deacetylase